MRTARVAPILFLLIATLPFYPSCQCNDDAKNNQTLQKEPVALDNANNSAIGAMKGAVKIVYDKPRDDLEGQVATFLKDSRHFENLVFGINNTLALPQDVIVRFDTKDGPAFYSDSKEIHFPYQFLLSAKSQYQAIYPEEEENNAEDFAIKLASFVLFHELGHAFANIFDLPLTGNEETAVDNLAVIISLESQSNGLEMVMNAAEGFDISDQLQDGEHKEEQFQDEHALDPQRFYNVLCMVYGKNPDAITALVKTLHNKLLSDFLQERGGYCLNLYEKEFKAWMKLLGPYFKTQN